MKTFHLISRNCKGLAIVLFQHHRISAFLSTSCTSHSRKKKVNGYEDVDQERYNSLVRMVRSSRTSSQTPERIFEEDNFLYGKVIKSQLPSQEPEPRVPQSYSSLCNSNKVILPTEKTDPSIPVKIGLPARDQMASGRLPSVTRILQQTMPMEQAFHLERWKQRMIMELGEEGFIAYTAAVFSQGKLFHARLEDVLQCRDEDIHRPEDTEAMSGYLTSVEHVLSDVAELRTLESAVLHSELKYLGIVDCIAHYRGRLCIIDWKTSEKQKAHIQRTFDNPLQIAAYVGALNHDANYNFQVQLSRDNIEYGSSWICLFCGQFIECIAHSKAAHTPYNYLQIFCGQMEKVQRIPPSTLNCVDGIICTWANLLHFFHLTTDYLQIIVDCGLIVVAYKDGSPAHAHFMDPELCKYYWDKWLLRLEEYKEKKEEKK